MLKLMTDLHTYLPSHAEVLTSACLDLLEYNAGDEVEDDPVVDFAAALHAKEPDDKLLELYRQIKSPGMVIVSALVRHFLAHGNSSAAAALFDDLDPADFAPAQRVLYAGVLAERGDFDAALDQIARAYDEDDTIKDAHARIAWKIFWPKKEYDKVIEWMERDAGEAVGQ